MHTIILTKAEVLEELPYEAPLKPRGIGKRKKKIKVLGYVTLKVDGDEGDDAKIKRYVDSQKSVENSAETLKINAPDDSSIGGYLPVGGEYILEQITYVASRPDWYVAPPSAPPSYTTNNYGVLKDIAGGTLGTRGQQDVYSITVKDRKTLYFTFFNAGEPKTYSHRYWNKKAGGKRKVRKTRKSKKSAKKTRKGKRKA